jgi:hypothetical protein
VLGPARGAHGMLRFTPAAGPPGRRTIDALVSENGAPRERIPVTSYRAPAPAAPSTVRGLRVSRRGRRFQIRFGPAPGAAYYELTIIGSDGRHLVRLMHGQHPHLTLPVLGYNDHITVKVVAVSPLGRTGRAVSARA